jgi:hypothetical protein
LLRTYSFSTDVVKPRPPRRACRATTRTLSETAVDVGKNEVILATPLRHVSVIVAMNLPQRKCDINHALTTNFPAIYRHFAGDTFPKFVTY